MSPDTLVQAAPRSKWATTIEIDRERFREFFWRRRMTLASIGPCFNRCDGWASVIVAKGHAGFFALDDLATALGMNVDELIYQVGTDRERELVSIS